MELHEFLETLKQGTKGIIMVMWVKTFHTEIKIEICPKSTSPTRIFGIVLSTIDLNFIRYISMIINNPKYIYIHNGP